MKLVVDLLNPVLDGDWRFHVRRHAEAVDLLKPSLLDARRRGGTYVRLCR